MGKPAIAPSIPSKPPWMDLSGEQQEQHGSRKKLKKEYEMRAKKTTCHGMGLYMDRVPKKTKPKSHDSSAIAAEPQKTTDTRIISQSRKLSGSPDTHQKSGLADFLYRQRVESPRRNDRRQTAKHVIMFCPLAGNQGALTPGYDVTRTTDNY